LRARGGLPAAQALQQRQGEGGGLAGAGLGAGHQVAAGEDRWDRFALDRGGGVIAFVRHGSAQGGGQTEVCKIHRQYP
jgi:hypothetical protein